jgi:glutathione synthase/RimK-type ligase-like ATP-grasp enzyme
MRMAWVTTQEAIGRDPDHPYGVPALEAAGIEVATVDWKDPSVDWVDFDRVLPRSTWDYPEVLDRFLAWVDAVDAVTDLRNSPATMRWSIDKHYLADLADAAIPVTPTEFVEVGAIPAFPPREFVVKPAIGAGSRDAAAYAPGQEDVAAAHVARLHARDASVLVQPKLASIATEGEWPLVFFHGDYSHAASKRVTLANAAAVDDLYAEETNAAFVATSEQIEVAQAVVDLAASRFGVPPYARIDLVRGDDGRMCVLEVEMVEPSLFLPEGGPGAVARFVDAVTA